MNPTTETSVPSNLPAPEPRLRRSVNGSLGGVASGIANYFGIEAKWVRLGFLASIFLGGIGFLGYIALWMGLPDEHDTRASKFALTQNLARLIVAGIFTVFAVASLTNGADVSSSLLLPALLVGGGLYLLNQRDDVDLSVGGQHPKAEAPTAWTGVVPPPPPSKAPGENTAEPHDTALPPNAVVDDRDPLLVEAERLMTGDAFMAPNAPDPRADDPDHWAMTRTEATQVATRRKRPPIVTFALGAAALVSALALVSSGGAIPGFVYPFIFLGMAVLGFFASLLFRRPAWILLPISFIAFALGMGGIFGAAAFEDGIGEISIERRTLSIGIPDAPAVPTVPGAPDELFEHGVGKLELDFDDLSLSEDRTVEAKIGVGLIEIDTPDDVATRVLLTEGGKVHFGDGIDRDFEAGTVLVLTENGVTDGPTLTIEAVAELGVIDLDVDSDGYERR